MTQAVASRAGWRVRAAALAAAAACAAGALACEQAPARSDTLEWPAGASAEIDKAIAAPGVPQRDGLAAAIFIDVSGSMAQAPKGQAEPKIVSARRAATDLVDQFVRYAAQHPDETVLLGLYEFSRRPNAPDIREVIPMSAPDRTRAAESIAAMKPAGGTPIGGAVIAGKQALDRTGLTRRHLLVVTDGENTDGYPPAAVAAAIARRPEIERPSLYFIAFDVTARRFTDVKDAGALVFEAADSRGLTATLDSLLSGQILLER